MATSGSVDFNLTAHGVITRALRLCRALGQGQTPLGDVLASGLDVLNLQLKGWQAKGALLSALTQATPITLTGAESYALTPRPLVVQDVRYRSAAGIDTPLFEETRESYLSIPNKSSTGRPSLYWFDRQRTTSTLYVWQVASTGTIPYSYKRVLEDVDNLSDDLDIAQEHLEAVVYGLAVRLGSELPSVDMAGPHMMAIAGRASELERDMFADSRPKEYRFVPDMR
jgi:hypothetical protein